MSVIFRQTTDSRGTNKGSALSGSEYDSTLLSLLNNGVKTYENIDALKVANPSGWANKTVVYVKGYYTAGDGGGGIFYWNNTSISSDNGGTVIKPTNVETGRWIRDISQTNYINIKWFGCQEGGADITNSFLKARSFAVSERRYLFAPAGDYYFEGLISITSDSGLIGEAASARLYSEFRGTVFIKNSDTAEFRISHSTYCAHFVVNANEYNVGISIEQTTSGTAGAKFAHWEFLWVINYHTRAYDLSDYIFNLTMISCKSRSSGSALNPVGIYAVHESSGVPNGITSPSVVIINPSIYGPSESSPRGVALEARGLNALTVLSGEFVKHSRWLSLNNCEGLFSGVDFEFANNSSVITDSQIEINGGIVHTYRGSADDWNLDNIPFTSSRRFLFRVNQSSFSCQLTLNNLEFRNYLGSDTGTPDNDLGVVGVEQNISGNEYSSVQIINDRYEQGLWGNKISIQQNRGDLAPYVNLGKFRHNLRFTRTFSGSETGDQEIYLNGISGYAMIPNMYVVRSVYIEEINPLNSDVAIKIKTYDSNKGSESVYNMGSFTAGSGTGFSNSAEIQNVSRGFFKVFLTPNSSFAALDEVALTVQIEER